MLHQRLSKAIQAVVSQVLLAVKRLSPIVWPSSIFVLGLLGRSKSFDVFPCSYYARLPPRDFLFLHVASLVLPSFPRDVPIEPPIVKVHPSIYGDAATRLAFPSST